MRYHVYIVRCRDGTFYTGITKDLEKRLGQHNAGKAGAKYTRSRRPVNLVFSEIKPTRSAALKSEARIRKLSRDGKRNLIVQYTARWGG